MTRILKPGGPGWSTPATERSTTPQDVRLRKMGIDPTTPLGPAQIGATTIGEVLGRGRYARFEAVRVPGRVAWVNFELARQMGFDVPPSNTMTPALEKQLIEALSWRALEAGEEAGDRETITMIADKYGGTALVRNEGAGRAGFLPWGNLTVKGVGKTPLLDEETSDFLHGHGGAPMREGLLEAIWGEVNTNLFTRGSTQILAVIDTGDETVFPDGSREKRALIIRAGEQLRPAHLLAGEEDGHKQTTSIFLEAARRTGLLRTEGDQPDVRETMTAVADAHAKTAAEQVRWRVLHGAVSTSNMEFDGAQMDLATETSQARTAPIHVLAHGQTYLNEHVERAVELQRSYDAVVDGLSKRERKQYNGKKLAVERVMRDRYDYHLGVQFLKAAGLKERVAERIAEAEPDLATSYRTTLLEMAKLTNRDGRFNAEEDTHDDKSVVDVFNMLGGLPGAYFDEPGGDHRETIRSLLKPLISSNPRHAGGLVREVDELVDKFAPLYHEVMQAALTHGADAYDDLDAMKRAVTQRAAFENVPMDQLYRKSLHDMLVGKIGEYQATGDADLFREAVDKTIAASVRNVDALIGQGTASRLNDGGVELGARTIDGIGYSVRAWDSGRRRLHLEVPVTPEGDGFRLPTLPGAPHLSHRQVENLSYLFTTDGWKTNQQVEARLGSNEDGAPVLTFDIPKLRSDVGQLEGLFYCEAGGFWLKDGASNFRGYSFAVPDNVELEAIEARLAE